jgi:tripartite-type tricarboxylate transporter receptor subunit TctC
VVPAGTPSDVVETINRKINSILEEKDLKERLSSLGAETAGGTPQEFAAYVAREIPKWERIVKVSGARAE